MKKTNISIFHPSADVFSSEAGKTKRPSVEKKPKKEALLILTERKAKRPSEENPQFKLINENSLPVLFNKKRKEIVIKPLIYVRSDTGKTRHFTPAVQEWFNSIYAYNKNYIKSLSIADKNLMSLLKSYLNSRINQKMLEKYKKYKKPKALDGKKHRMSTKRVFISKGELKHISSKVLITFYLYNTEGMFLSHKVRWGTNFLLFPVRKLKKIITFDGQKRKIITYNRLFTLLEYLESPDRMDNYHTMIRRHVWKQTTLLMAINKYYKNLTSLVYKKILSNEDKFIIFNNKVQRISFKDYPKIFYDFSFFISNVKLIYLRKLKLNMIFLKYNKAKFTRIYITKLRDLVKKIYNKSVEFNFVNLRKMHLNSDIYTQAVALKLRNRNNKLYRVLKSSLRKVKVIQINKLAEKRIKIYKHKLRVNKIRNITVSTMLNNKNNNNIYISDHLGNLLLKFFPSIYNLKGKGKKKWSIKKYPISLTAFVIRHLKHTNVRGIRVEAKGRLTRRFTASRSVFKMKWKGGLKNVESSFRGWSAIMLRGILKSNVQYSTISSKNRNGAFGVKGWVSSK